MGHEHHGLIGLGFAFAVDVADENGQRYRQRDVQNDEDDVVEQGVAQNLGEVAKAKEVLEVIKGHPVAVEQAGQEVLARCDRIILECKDDAEHGQIAEEYVPYCGRQRQNGQLSVVLGPPAFLFCRLCLDGCRSLVLLHTVHLFLPL